METQNIDNNQEGHERAKSIERLKWEFKRIYLTEENIKKALEYTLQKIKFLESIYIPGRKNSNYSQEFRNIAYKERQNLCLESNALNSILREMQGEQCKN